MKLTFSRNKPLFWLILGLVVAVTVIWSWSRVAQYYTSSRLHTVLSWETNLISPALADAGFAVASVQSATCVHPSGRSVWLVDIGCQDFSQLKSRQSIAKSQKLYTENVAKFEAALKEHGWSGGHRVESHPGPDAIVYTKTIDSVDCRLVIWFAFDSNAVECDKSVKVPVLPVPYFYEYYGGG
jgi:hypothetical protein